MSKNSYSNQVNASYTEKKNPPETAVISNETFPTRRHSPNLASKLQNSRPRSGALMTDQQRWLFFLFAKANSAANSRCFEFGGLLESSSRWPSTPRRRRQRSKRSSYFIRH